MSFHIEAKKDEIAKKVLMPGDPLRAKYIAENFIENIKLVNDDRGILAYTGTYKDIPITVMASGMGLSSMAIYAEELFDYYEVDEIIRIGTCGSHNPNIRIKDIIVVNKAITNANFAYSYNGKNVRVISGNNEINNHLIDELTKNNYHYHVANAFSTETFYTKYDNISSYIDKFQIGVSEMESFSLFYVAEFFHKKAACLLTVSDCLYETSDPMLTSIEKETAMNEMIITALSAIIK